MIVDKSLYVDKNLGQSVKCPNPDHQDKNPSAIFNESNIYCFVCSKAFFFENYKHQNLYISNSAQAKDYHNNLKNAESNSQIKQYLAKRNIASNYLLDEFQLGFDYEKNAIVFPIKNVYGDINGFGFRSIIDSQEPKYWNSAGKDKCDSIFEKSNNLYGIDKITDECEHLIICEGYICVISAFKKEFKNDVCFVATMGTALGENHIKLLKKKNIKKISLMFDTDDAGKNATLSAIKVLLEGNIYPNVIVNFNKDSNSIDFKDIDELLQKNGGSNYLKKLVNENCHDFFDYLLKQQISNEDLKKYVIEYVKDNKRKGEYATKLCSIRGLYNNLQLEKPNYGNVLSLNKEDAKEYFYEEEKFSNFGLPRYFKFNKVLEWAKVQVKKLDNRNIADFKKLKDANYKILGNKNGEYAWRQYQIINPILYVKLVNVICDNWEEIKKFFDSKNDPKNIVCASIPVIKDKDDKFINNAARQIMNWWDEIEQDSIKNSLKYKYVIHTDIVDCYGSIYTHSITWALHTKPYMKKLIEEMKNDKNLQQKYNSLLGTQIDNLLQCMSHGQTNGIPQGSVLMDFIAEILLRYIDQELIKKIEQHSENLDFYILRYRDDYRIFANEIGVAKKLLKYLSEVLAETGGMRLSSEKTEISSCIVSGSIKKDKIHYFEYFKKSKSIRKNILNIYLFSKKFPNSGSIKRLLNLFEDQVSDRINQMSLSFLQNKPLISDLYPLHVISVLSEIMYNNPGTYARVCSIINRIICVMKNDDRKDIIKMVSDKMSDVPNNELLYIWLERATYIDNQDIDGWYEFYLRCEANNGLLYKQYTKNLIWEFTPQVDIQDMPLIIDDKITDVLDKASKKCLQHDDVNQNPFGRFTDKEADIFAGYMD